ncbi:glycosyltransferase family 9 protein [Azospirillum doebereinerae]|uniref:Lipopolysaccharide heptosyltransferase family protein n=1 Tax=Azospirillum doebereinerae TaxID=92933 RepID=A0A433JCS4_9PROT|nr:glycosyltransferase family 9 protein [Azospirillum doebereinerae]RUQ74480.1 lipopolysaccharide heptosyltransferase family protein [Azospirillum doebereinerae]
MSRILVIKLGAFGDFILAQSALSAIRRHHAGDRLSLLTIPSLAPLARMSGLFDEVLEDPRERTLSAYLHVRRLLRAGRFDRVYDLQGQPRTDRYFRLMFPGPWPEWSGTARRASHSDRYEGRRTTSVLARYTRQLAPFGIVPDAAPDLSWLDADIDRFGLAAPFALLIPGSSSGRPDKRWPMRRYAEVAAALAERGVTPVVLGTAIEVELAQSIVGLCPRALDLTGKTDVPELAGLARRAWAAIGNDTGPTHLIAAVGCPTVAVFSDASNPIHSIGPRVVVHHRPAFDTMDTAGVLAALERARQLNKRTQAS